MTYDPSQYSPRRHYDFLRYQWRRAGRWLRGLRYEVSAYAVVAAVVLVAIIAGAIAILAPIVLADASLGASVRYGALSALFACALSAIGLIGLTLWQLLFG